MNLKKITFITFVSLIALFFLSAYGVTTNIVKYNHSVSTSIISILRLLFSIPLILFFYVLWKKQSAEHDDG